MKNKLNRNGSSDEEPAEKPKKQTHSIVVPNLRKFGFNRLEQPTSSVNKIEKFLEQFELIPIGRGLNTSSNISRVPTKFDFQNEQLNPERPLVDQIINKNSYHNQIEAVSDKEVSKIELMLRSGGRTKPESASKPQLFQSNQPPRTELTSPLYRHLSNLGSKLVPIDSFEHIKHESTRPVKFELIYGENEYWPVKVKKIQYSNLYQLKFVAAGDNDSDSSRVWESSGKIYLPALNGLHNLKPLGWSKENKRMAKKPPDDLDINELLIPNTDSDRDSGDDLEEKYFKEAGNFEESCDCEVIDDESGLVKRAIIKRNVNGRLLIEFPSDKSTQWIFSNDPRVNFRTDSNLNNIHNSLRTNENGNHNQHFTAGSYLECLYMNRFYVGQVIEASSDVNKRVLSHLEVRIDSGDAKINSKTLKFYYKSSNSPFHTLFPCNWCSSNNLLICPPNGWPPGKPFDWKEFESRKPNYFTKSTDIYTLFNWSRSISQLASEKFQIGSYLECVDPLSGGEIICLGRIRARVEHLIFVELFYEGCPGELSVFSVDSSDLFPLGWCEMNNYYESQPGCYSKYLSSPYSRPSDVSETSYSLASRFKINANQWSDKIYLDTVRNCGPYFKKPKLEFLPKCFGPGPLVFVLQQLIQMLINVSEKPFKLLKLLQEPRQMNRSKSSNSNLFLKKPDMFQRIRIKAKEKGKLQYREIDVCSQSCQLEEYLNEICVRLKCCLQMISTREPLPDPGDHYDTDKYCCEIKCCVLCSLNYFSKPNSTMASNEGETKLSEVGPKSLRLRPKLIDKPKFNLGLRHTMIKIKEKKTHKIMQRKIKKQLIANDPRQLRPRLIPTVSSPVSTPSSTLGVTLPSADNQSNPVNSSPIPDNPMNWGSKELSKYLLDNKFDPQLVYLIEEHELDGQSFLMLNLPTIQSYMNLKLGPALKLAHLVEKLKLSYFKT